MSHTCRLLLKWGGNHSNVNAHADTYSSARSSSSSSSSSLPSSCFYKRVDMSSLEHLRYKAVQQPTKVARDVRSYEVEASFLASQAIKELVKTGTVSVPACYHADTRRHSEPIESKFALLLEDFSPMDGWAQVRMLDHQESKAALVALARFHAFFLPSSTHRRSVVGAELEKKQEQEQELEKSIWNSGGYWQPNMQPGQMNILKKAWEETHMINFAEAFKNDDYIRNHVDLQTLGERLEAHARKIGAETHPFSDCEGAEEILTDAHMSSRLLAIKTVIHGKHSYHITMLPFFTLFQCR